MSKEFAAVQHMNANFTMQKIGLAYLLDKFTCHSGAGKLWNENMLTKLMVSKPAKDIALVASLLAFGAVLINRPDLPPIVTAGILIILTALITVIGVRRENTNLDEVELAAVNFGSRWSITVVIVFMLLLCFFGPVHNGIDAIFGPVAGARNENGPMSGVVLIFISGLLSGLVLLLASKSMLTRLWLWNKR
ncbi:hypothetical protein [Altererythrobacter ishigakiensis]|nr:hypothetical protein [Altererythrobacter ishigakiensis]